MNSMNCVNLLKYIILNILKKLFILIVCLFAFSGCLIKNDKLSVSKDNVALQKKQNDCDKYVKTMNYASSYILEEFENAYFKVKDIQGAKAQLFLVQNQSKSIFAQNINKAEKSYNAQYKLAKVNQCVISQYKISPLQKIKKRINALDNNNENIIDK